VVRAWEGKEEGGGRKNLSLPQGMSSDVCPLKRSSKQYQCIHEFTFLFFIIPVILQLTLMMDKFRVANEHLPSRLYRIKYPGSRTAYSDNEGFAAADETKIYKTGEEDEFKQDVEKQFTWGCRDPSPFISLFSDREHAENWGQKEPWRGKLPSAGSDQWSLCIIDTKVLGDAYFFRLSEVVEGLNLEIPKKAAQHISGAYLCLHKVPAIAIIDKISSHQVKNGKQNWIGKS